MNKNGNRRVDDIIGRINNCDDLIFDTDFDCDMDCEIDCHFNCNENSDIDYYSDDCNYSEDYEDDCDSEEYTRSRNHRHLINECNHCKSDSCSKCESESPCEEDYEDECNCSFCHGMEEDYSQGYDEESFRCKKDSCRYSYRRGFGDGQKQGYCEGFEAGYEKAKREVMEYIRERKRKRNCCCCCKN